MFFLTAFVPKPEACLAFEKYEIHFGTLKAPWEKTAVFRFKNNSSDSIIIHDYKVHCGCTSVIFPKYYIAPGKSDSVLVKFLPQRWLNGSAEKDVMLYTNCKDSVITLTIKAEVEIY